MDDAQGMHDRGPLTFSAMDVVSRAPVRMFTYDRRPGDDQEYIGPVISLVPELATRANPQNALGMDLHSFIGVLWGASNELLSMIRPLQEVAGDLPGIVSASNTVHAHLESVLDGLAADLAAETADREAVASQVAAVDEALTELGLRMDDGVAAASRAREELGDRAGELESWRTTAEDVLAGLRVDVDDTRSRVATLEGWRPTITGRVTALETWQGPVDVRLLGLEAADRGLGTRLDSEQARTGQALDLATEARSKADVAVVTAGTAQQVAGQASTAAAAASQAAGEAKTAAAAAQTSASSAASAASSASSAATQARTIADAAQATATTASTAALAAQQDVNTLKARAPVMWRAVGNLPALAVGGTADVSCPWVTVPATLPTIAQCVPFVGPTLGATTAPVVKAVSSSGVTVTVRAGLAVTAAVGAITVSAVTW